MKVKKTKKLIAKKKSSKKSEEPWVKVLDMKVKFPGSRKIYQQQIP